MSSGRTMLLLAALVIFLPPAPRRASAGPARLDVLFTGEGAGYLEPCG